MEHSSADLQLALYHVQQIEQRIAELRTKIGELQSIGAPTIYAEDLLAALVASRQLLEKHLDLIIEASQISHDNEN